MSILGDQQELTHLIRTLSEHICGVGDAQTLGFCPVDGTQVTGLVWGLPGPGQHSGAGEGESTGPRARAQDLPLGYSGQATTCP